MNYKINIIVNEKKFLKKTTRKFVKNIVEVTLNHEKKIISKLVKPEVNLVFINDAQMQNLNSNYRAKDKPTNVLSFFYKGSSLIGEVVLSYEIIELEALEQKKEFANHLAHLIVHGLLHILGYDHEKSEQEAEIMEAKEVKILKKLGIKNPYVNN